MLWFLLVTYWSEDCLKLDELTRTPSPIQIKNIVVVDTMTVSEELQEPLLEIERSPSQEERMDGIERIASPNMTKSCYMSITLAVFPSKSWSKLILSLSILLSFFCSFLFSR